MGLSRWTLAGKHQPDSLQLSWLEERVQTVEQKSNATQGFTKYHYTWFSVRFSKKM